MVPKSRFDELSREIERAIETDNEELYISKSSELRDLYKDTALKYFESLDFPKASQYFNEAHELGNELSDHFKKSLDSLDPDKKKDGKCKATLENLLEKTEDDVYLAYGYYNLSLGLTNKMSRNSKLAVENFKKAQQGFAELFNRTEIGVHKIRSDYSKAMVVITEAAGDLITASFFDAKKKFQRAKIFLEDILENILTHYLEEEKDEVMKKEYEKYKTLLTIDCLGCGVIYYFSDSRDQYNKGNFSVSKEQAEKTCKLYYQSIESNLDSIPSKLRNIYRNIYLGEYHNYCGFKFLAEAQYLRENQAWDESLKCCRKAKEEWEKCVDFYLKSGIPQASAIQEHVMSQATIATESCIRQIQRERELIIQIENLKTEMNKLQHSLTEAIKPTGVTVNNMTEMVSTVEQNVQVVQKIENGVRTNIERLIDELDATSLNQDDKNKIEKGARDLLKTEEHGFKFLDRAKKFTKDVNEIVKNVGDIAKPITSILSALSLFL